MSEPRIDHKAEAEAVLGANGPNATFDPARDALAEAQIHAMLYLAEQQRIANLIALENQRWARVSEVGNYFGPDVLRGNPEEVHGSAPIKPEIREALEL